MTRSVVVWCAVLVTSTGLVHTQSRTQEPLAPSGQQPTGVTAGASVFMADWRLLFPDNDPVVRQMVIDNCSSCHDLRWVLAARYDQRPWEDTIWTMAANGARFELDDVQRMAKYLSTHFGADKKPLAVPVNINTAPADQLILLPSLAPYAHAIVNARARTSFVSVDDLLKIDGITKDALDEAKPFLITKE